MGAVLTTTPPTRTVTSTRTRGRVVMPEDRNWVNDVELEDVKVKWAFSHFDGREDTFNAEGAHNFTAMLSEEIADKMRADGWAVRDMPGSRNPVSRPSMLTTRRSDG